MEKKQKTENPTQVHTTVGGVSCIHQPPLCAWTGLWGAKGPGKWIRELICTKVLHPGIMSGPTLLLVLSRPYPKPTDRIAPGQGLASGFLPHLLFTLWITVHSQGWEPQLKCQILRRFHERYWYSQVSACHMPDVPHPQCILSGNLHNNLKCCHDHSFAKEETEAQRDTVLSSRPHSCEWKAWRYSQHEARCLRSLTPTGEVRRKYLGSLVDREINSPGSKKGHVSPDGGSCLKTWKILWVYL